MTDMRMPAMGGRGVHPPGPRQGGCAARSSPSPRFQNLANANQLARLEVYCCLIKPVLLTKLEETLTRALAEGDEPVRAEADGKAA